MHDTVAAAAGLTMRGKPMVANERYEGSFEGICFWGTPDEFPIEISYSDKVTSQSWGEFPNLTSQTTIRGHTEFTNLTSGASVTNSYAYHDKVTFSEDGFSVTTSGAQVKVKGVGPGILAYSIGRSSFSVDFTTSPPTVTSTSPNHENLSVAPGPCDAVR
jgi:hypothetical protein